MFVIIYIVLICVALSVYHWSDEIQKTLLQLCQYNIHYCTEILKTSKKYKYIIINCIGNSRSTGGTWSGRGTSRAPADWMLNNISGLVR